MEWYFLQLRCIKWWGKSIWEIYWITICVKLSVTLLWERTESSKLLWRGTSSISLLPSWHLIFSLLNLDTQNVNKWVVLECYRIPCFRLLRIVLDLTDVYAMHIQGRERNRLHIHIFNVPKMGLTLTLFCSHTGNRQYQQPFHLHDHGAILWSLKMPRWTANLGWHTAVFSKCGAVTRLSLNTGCYILLGIGSGWWNTVVTNGAMNFHRKLCYTSGTMTRAS